MARRISCPAVHKMMIEEELSVDADGKTDGSLAGDQSGDIAASDANEKQQNVLANFPIFINQLETRLLFVRGLGTVCLRKFHVVFARGNFSFLE
ncbi:hypothetical protein DKX38_009531 [Salix brachista]|uniref:Uncharacterized protein n=1 Tax=Salix brachista TaxID=2182728 RepID=A0A5N5MAQ5_9ROSI|nr:hypothetical protein DKX38_009531 [Salix brachista]